jgi:hypothetical protein
MTLLKFVVLVQTCWNARDDACPNLLDHHTKRKFFTVLFVYLFKNCFILLGAMPMLHRKVCWCPPSHWLSWLLLLLL